MKTTANSKLSILVVDDDENIRMVLRQSLEKEGYHVSTANSSEEALNTLQRSFFHVVITDIMMGEMNGVELLLQIKEMNSLMQIYVMTSHGTLPHVIQCMQGDNSRTRPGDYPLNAAIFKGTNISPVVHKRSRQGIIGFAMAGQK